MSSFSFSHSMPLQDLPCLSVQVSSRINKRKARGCVSESLDIESTPTELIQQWLPSYKHQRLIPKGKENDSSQFVLARRSRKKKEFMSGRDHFPAPVQQLHYVFHLLSLFSSGISLDHLPDELLLRILFYLPLQDLLRMSVVSKHWNCLT